MRFLSGLARPGGPLCLVPDSFCRFPQEIMVKGRLLKNTICLVAWLFGLTAGGMGLTGSAGAQQTETGKVDAVIVLNASMGAGTSGKRDGAILFTDSDAIARHVALFLDNRQQPHACGYTYDIKFWSGDTLLKTVEYNSECGEEFARDTESIASLMQEYDRRFISREVETIHRLAVPVTVEPQSLMQTMRQDGLHVFLPGGPSSRYPRMEISFSLEGKDREELEKEAQEKARQFLDNWPEDLPRPLGCRPPYSSGGMDSRGYARITVKTQVWFPLATDLKTIAAALETETRVVSRMNEPETYLLMLIHPEDSKAVIRTVLEKYRDIEVR